MSVKRLLKKRVQSPILFETVPCARNHLSPPDWKTVETVLVLAIELNAELKHGENEMSCKHGENEGTDPPVHDSRRKTHDT